MDEKLKIKCENCNYTAKTNWNVKLHYLTNHSTIEERKTYKYYCEICDVVLLCEKYYVAHCESKKHKQLLEASVALTVTAAPSLVKVMFLAVPALTEML